MDKDKVEEDEHIFNDENKKYRTVRYHPHGILEKTFYLRGEDREPGWVFDCQNDVREFIGEEAELIDILDELSKEGYELICGSDDEYILRTKNEIEEIEEYWDTEDL